jgi:hypothetical protein
MAGARPGHLDKERSAFPSGIAGSSPAMTRSGFNFQTAKDFFFVIVRLDRTIQ